MAPTRSSTRKGAAPATPRRLQSVERWLLAEEIGAFVRHELRNKLTSMKAALFLLNRRLRTELGQGAVGSGEGAGAGAARAEVSGQQAEGRGPPQRAAALAEILGQEVERANDVLGSLPATAPARRIEAVSVRECIEQAVAGTDLPASVQVEWTVEPPAVEALVDPAEVVVALRSLLENAVEALADGGRVTVAARAERETLVVEVRDDGRGIPFAERSDVMRSFYSTKIGHAGLGLPIARRAVERYGGELTLPEGNGSRVALTFVGVVLPGRGRRR